MILTTITLKQAAVALLCYLGFDRLIYGHTLTACRYIINFPQQDWSTLSACVCIGMMRILACLVAINVLLSIPTSSLAMPLLCAADMLMHNFFEAAKNFDYSDPKGKTAVKFCRWMSISQIVMLLISIAFVLNGIRLRQYL